MERYEFSLEQRSLLESMEIPFGVYQMVDKRVVTLLLSDGLCHLFGYKERDEAYQDMSQSIFQYEHPDDEARIADAAIRFATEGGVYEVIYRAKAKGSSEYHMIHATGRHVYPQPGVQLAYVWYVDEGIYSEKNDTGDSVLFRSLKNALYEESILRANYYDAMTGLPCMSYFFELADAGKAANAKEGCKTVMMFFDLCGMKYYNTRHGFSEGDKLIRSFAKLLSDTFSNDNCGRVGADHFVAYAKQDGIEETLRGMFHNVRKLNDGKYIPVHVGIYVSGTENIPVGGAFDRAKIASDSLKNRYGSCFHYYRIEQKKEVEQHQYILSNLGRAIEEKWIQVYYQGIVDAKTGEICEEEALARWIDPEKGFLSPAEFIPFLEEGGVVYKLDLCVLEQVLEKMKILKAKGLRVLPQSINLSRSDFDSCDIVEEILKRVDAAGVGRDKISIEITESIVGSDFDFIKKKVERFRRLGFSVWMDDFGSGYSSFDALQSIPFSLLKFDMSFMKKLDEGSKGKIILTQLMKLATELGLDTVCEGVETDEQARFMREIGCSKLQGYYFSKPAPPEQIVLDEAK